MKKQKVLLIFDKYCAGNSQLDRGIGDYVFIQTIKKIDYIEPCIFYLYLEDVHNQSDLYQRLESTVREFQPEIIILTPHFISSKNGNTCIPERNFMRNLSKGITLILMTYDTGNDKYIIVSTEKPHQKTTWVGYWDGYADIIVHTDNYFYAKSAFNEAKSLSQHIYGFTPFDPCIIPNRTNKSRDLDYAFMGSVYQYRSPFVKALESLPYKGFLGNGPLKKDYLPYQEYLEVLTQSKIAINFSKSWRGDGEQIKVRIWEILNSGALLFEQDSQESRRILEKYDCAVFFTTPEDLAQKINFYLTNPELIAKKLKATEQFLTDYDYQTFWQLVINSVNNLQYSKEIVMTNNNFKSWIETIHSYQEYPDLPLESSQNLEYLQQLGNSYKPNKIIEIGTKWGLSLRTWLKTNTDIDQEIISIDFDFNLLNKSQDWLPIDLSKVNLLQQDIFTIDFSQLWNSEDRILLYINLENQAGIPVMEYIVNNAIPQLPLNSLVVINNIWYSPTVFNQQKINKFIELNLHQDIEPFSCFDVYYGNYWQGGSILGGNKIISLMECINNNNLEIKIKSKIPMISFQIEQPISLKPINKSLYSYVQYHPLERFSFNKGSENHPEVKKALTICQQGLEMYKLNKIKEAQYYFQEGSKVTKKLGGMYYAQAICSLKLGQLENSINLLKKEINNDIAYPNAQFLLSKLQTETTAHS